MINYHVRLDKPGRRKKETCKVVWTKNKTWIENHSSAYVSEKRRDDFIYERTELKCWVASDLFFTREKNYENCTSYIYEWIDAML